eukprot:m.292021 g.292021  ORF g.292021 m.292021 type:complete len:339 (-) comp12553_c0_seq1:146-1162(-)
MLPTHRERESFCCCFCCCYCCWRVLLLFWRLLCRCISPSHSSPCLMFAALGAATAVLCLISTLCGGALLFQAIEGDLYDDLGIFSLLLGSRNALKYVVSVFVFGTALSNFLAYRMEKHVFFDVSASGVTFLLIEGEFVILADVLTNVLHNKSDYGLNADDTKTLERAYAGIILSLVGVVGGVLVAVLANTKVSLHMPTIPTGIAGAIYLVGIVLCFNTDGLPHNSNLRLACLEIASKASAVIFVAFLGDISQLSPLHAATVPIGFVNGMSILNGYLNEEDNMPHNTKIGVIFLFSQVVFVLGLELLVRIFEHSPDEAKKNRDEERAPLMQAGSNSIYQ